ncbi:MAG TPA: hypothetical protein VGD24_01870 [Gallionella sp.]
MGSIYKTTMIHNSNHPSAGRKIEELHSAEEIIHHANEVLAQQMGLDLYTFAGLEEVEVRDFDGDWIYYVDQSGRRVEFSEKLQLQAAIAVLNSSGQYFEVTPIEESGGLGSGFA